VFGNLEYVWIGVLTHYVLDIAGSKRGIALFYPLWKEEFGLPIGVAVSSKRADLMMVIVTVGELALAAALVFEVPGGASRWGDSYSVCSRLPVAVRTVRVPTRHPIRHPITYPSGGPSNTRMPAADRQRPRSDFTDGQPPIRCDECRSALRSDRQQAVSFLLLDQLTIPVLSCDDHLERFTSICGLTTEATADLLHHRPAGGITCPGCRLAPSRFDPTHDTGPGGDTRPHGMSGTPVENRSAIPDGTPDETTAVSQPRHHYERLIVSYPFVITDGHAYSGSTAEKNDSRENRALLSF